MFRFARVIIRIGRRHLGVDRPQPCVQLVLQDFVPNSGDDSAMFLPLADVVAEVVQLDAMVVVELDQPVVAAADGAVGRRAALLVVLVVRVVPEQRPFGQFAASAAAAARGSRRRRRRSSPPASSGHFQDRREQVHRDDRRRRSLPAFVTPGQ